MNSVQTQRPAGTVPPRRQSGVVVPHEPRWDQRAAAFALYSALSSITATMRWRLIDPSGAMRPSTEPAIYCIWHNRLATCLKGYWTFGHPRSHSRGLAALVSASRDGGFLTGVLECFRVQPVRGSSSRRGAQALLELSSWAARGYDLAITPDGPRGPRYVVHAGVMSLAQVTGLPILPVTINLSRKIELKSWDRFQIPLPFCRGDVVIAPPVRVDHNATDEEREACRLRVQAAMLDNTRD